MNKLDESRIKINDIDKRMIKLFKERMNAVNGVLEYKIDNNMDVLDSTREKNLIIKNMKELNDPILEGYYLDFFSGVLKSSKDYQKDTINSIYRFALLGNKISYSYSPLIHNLFYKRNNLSANYSILDINKEELKSTLNLLRIGKYHGYNVTIPYKEVVMDYLDEIDSSAKKIGAVNTIICRNNKLVGYNTDYYGFKGLLERNLVDLNGKNVYILGTGGAAACVKAVTIDLGGIPTFVSRTRSDNDTVTYDEFYMISNVDVIVNTTPLGTFPKTELCPLKDGYSFDKKTVVDIIYNPKQTTLLKRADSEINGLYMLFEQAIKADNIFLDKDYLSSEALYNEIKDVINFE